MIKWLNSINIKYDTLFLSKINFFSFYLINSLGDGRLMFLATLGCLGKLLDKFAFTFLNRFEIKVLSKTKKVS